MRILRPPTNEPVTQERLTTKVAKVTNPAIQTSNQIREAFLAFFESKGHTRVASSSLVPGDDPTLLFTNAGMNQFKDCFLGLEKRAYTRAVSSQKCVRAGGKHNDLENVGYTARHHTFFEMLGNFSFGDYFKRDAIHYAWEFLTSPTWLGLPKDKLWVTVYHTDDEAFALWNTEIGVPAERIIRIGDNKGAKYASDNFWAMGDTGPCGPCTEIFYDHGEGIYGGPPGSPEEDGDRYIEIWNNVFMQFNRTADGVMHPLPAPSVDTGMGLERISAVLQHVHSNYEIDLFQALLKAVREVTGFAEDSPSLCVIADHIRSCSFLVCDGVIPSNEGRGYVLRRIIRRAVRHGHKLAVRDAFFYKLVAALAAEMGGAYPDLVKHQAHVERVLKAEEEQFAKTLDQGMKIFEAAVAELDGKLIPGEVLFKLYDTYGFPIDLTGDIARERGLDLDVAGFEAEMDKQRKRSQEAGKFALDYNALLNVDRKTPFTGYERVADRAEVVKLYRGSEEVTELRAGDEGLLVLDHSPFYAESGGQCGDTGEILTAAGVFQVFDTQKAGEAIVHQGKLVSGQIALGEAADAQVDLERRHATMANHSATHLLHAALRLVLGEHVHQKGSLVEPERLRFDFSHTQGLSRDELNRIEALVNAQIRANNAVQTDVTDIESAMKKGAMALFGEKYGDTVRVLTMGDFSVELCGGTHVGRTGDIGLFKIVSEGGIAAGVRRIEAVTAEGALAEVKAKEQLVHELAGLVKGDAGSVLAKVAALVERSRKLEKELEQAKAKLAMGGGSDLASKTQDIKGVKLLAQQMDGVDAKALRDAAQQLNDKLGQSVVVLATVTEDKVNLVVGVSKALNDRVKAGDLVGFLAGQVGGKGGGRPDLAMAGGSDAAALPKALDSVHAWVSERL
ncbi:MAG: alanine--tRNA ligase [Gammaproteobacteria bacterium]|nr:alanine--tRNA ligase [Gammaproteobacteria bacterium]